MYSAKLLQAPELNHQLNSTTSFKFTMPLTMAGICVNENYRFGLANRLRGQRSLSYSQIIPATVQLNDTVKANVSGFQLGVTFLSIDFVRKKNMHVFASLGFNTGRVKLNDPASLKQKNPFFSPKLSLKPTYRISSIYIALGLDYEYDVSKKQWKNMRNAASDQLPVRTLSQTGITASICLGYIFKFKPNR